MAEPWKVSVKQVLLETADTTTADTNHRKPWRFRLRACIA